MVQFNSKLILCRLGFHFQKENEKLTIEVKQDTTKFLTAKI